MNEEYLLDAVGALDASVIARHIEMKAELHQTRVKRRIAFFISAAFVSSFAAVMLVYSIVQLAMTYQ